MKVGALFKIDNIIFKEEYSELSVDENFIGVKINRGITIPKNNIKAFRHLLMAAKQGNHFAMNLPWHYFYGKGVNQDFNPLL